jgi:hypothetical protein
VDPQVDISQVIESIEGRLTVAMPLVATGAYTLVASKVSAESKIFEWLRHEPTHKFEPLLAIGHGNSGL